MWDTTAREAGVLEAVGYAEETVRRLRPCLRRAASTLRPPLVFIRERKPWVFFRWRLRGRYVRFMVLEPSFLQQVTGKKTGQDTGGARAPSSGERVV